MPYRHIASLLAGDIIASVFRELGIDVRLKWPNDIILNDHKICGILVEEREGDILVGIGINLVSAPESDLLRKDWVLPASCLNTRGSAFSPLGLWTKIVASGKERLEKIAASMTPETFLENLETGMAWIGREIRVQTDTCEPFRATLVGIAPDGGLKILRNGNKEVIYTGTIRPI